MQVPNWPNFLNATRDSVQHPIVEKAVALFGRRGEALDLGCGAGRDTRYLLSQGWRVTAVDREDGAMDILARFPQENLRAVQSSIEGFEYEPEGYDLVSAQFALPFVPRGRFKDAFTRVKASIKPDGIFTGQFFGVHDEWNTPDTDMTFLTRQEVDELLSDFIVLELTEEDRMGSTATGGEKHWHVFHILARKSTTDPA